MSTAGDPFDCPIGDRQPSSGVDIRICVVAFTCLLILICLLGMAAFGSVIFFLFRPLWTGTSSEPWWPYLHVNSLSVAVNSSPSGETSGNWTAHITVLNRDHKKSAFYDAIESQVLYKEERLAWTRLPPFDVGPDSQKNVTVALSASGLYVDDWVVGDIDADGSHGGVKFDLWFSVGVRSKALGRKFSLEEGFNVYCNGLPVRVSSSSEDGRKMLTGVCHDCNRDCHTQ